MQKAIDNSEISDIIKEKSEITEQNTNEEVHKMTIEYLLSHYGDTVRGALSIQGQKAVDAGYKLQNGRCYRILQNHGKRIAQTEVVLDSDEYYKGIQSKWVDVTIYDLKYFEDVVKQLKRLGFDKCPCTFELEYDPCEICGDDFEKYQFCFIL